MRRHASIYLLAMIALCMGAAPAWAQDSDENKPRIIYGPPTNDGPPVHALGELKGDDVDKSSAFGGLAFGSKWKVEVIKVAVSDGNVSAAFVINRTLRSKASVVRQCPAEALGAKADDTELSLRVTVTADSKISKTQVVGGDADAEKIAGCVTKQLRSLELPEVDGQATVEVTYKWKNPTKKSGTDKSESKKGTDLCCRQASNRPDLTFGELQVQGSLDKELVARVIRQHRRELQYCYEKELEANPDLAGKLEFKFTVAPEGDVVSALIVESTMHDKAVESCATSKIRRWVFPEPEGGGVVIVKIPVSFDTK